MSNQFQQLVDEFWNRTLFKFWPKGLKPNHLTCLRFFLIPVILYLLATEYFGGALFFFFLAALTDSFDGSWARQRKQISEYGIILDPLADKLLVILSALFLFWHYPYFQILLIMVIIDVLILVESLGLVIINHDITTPSADWTGKSKMIFQVMGLITIFLYLTTIWLPISLIFLYLAIFTGLLSWFNYSHRSLKLIKQRK